MVVFSRHRTRGNCTVQIDRRITIGPGDARREDRIEYVGGICTKRPAIRGLRTIEIVECEAVVEISGISADQDVARRMIEPRRDNDTMAALLQSQPVVTREF